MRFLSFSKTLILYNNAKHEAKILHKATENDIWRTLKQKTGTKINFRVFQKVETTKL